MKLKKIQKILEANTSIEEETTTTNMNLFPTKVAPIMASSVQDNINGKKKKKNQFLKFSPNYAPTGKYNSVKTKK